MVSLALLVIEMKEGIFESEVPLLCYLAEASEGGEKG
ncbi:hypothetical protein C8J48_3114 [Desmospora activa DSM 45169]|uniref:Uncharacterized protein n=1 Tax=Desmospora activa DSM 45169 TaxID=1121389 RepID=A0A2T4Z4H3_9BACL|nr:hypothetical protein C8J48_3114 [Desmospora activa DSM 45169]